MEQVFLFIQWGNIPKPPGLYDMGLSGSEWTNDWYASDYYSHSPVNDPQGPVKGTEKSCAGMLAVTDNTL
jgi:formylglycine-generating enzyme required for sulfatase activity